ncbi:MAG: thiamine pyrophosphate-binding protein, partial [Acidimicrobiales bacterium]
MIGAQVLLRTLLASGVDTCFMNPGTSEMHFVAALDDVPAMRSVLALFEGVAAGAADGYGRMSGRPAATLFHLGPGFGNAVANLHNARRARTPLVAVVGDHATYHQRYDAPLQSDIETLARNVSTSVIRPEGTSTLGSDAARAVAAARQSLGGVSTLILPADISWTDDPDAAPASPAAPSVGISPDPGEVSRVAGALRSGAPAAFLIGGAATTGDGLLVTAGLAERHGARV